MWYFAWGLGLGLAAAVGVLNALWCELRTAPAPPRRAAADSGSASPLSPPS